MGDAGAGDDLVVEVEASSCPPRRPAGRAGSRCSSRRAARRAPPCRMGRLTGAITLTPFSETTVSPASVSSQLPPESPARSTITEPGPMFATACFGDQDRRRPPRDLRGRDDHVLLRRVLGQRLAHLLVLLVGERAGVAALVLGVGDEVELERAAAERRDLLPGGAADVEAADDGAEALRGRDRLESRRRRRRARAPSPGRRCRPPWSSSGRSGRPRARPGASPRSRRRSPGRRARPSPARG